MVWIKHYASKLAQAVSVGLDRRFPVCRTGGVTAQEYSNVRRKVIIHCKNDVLEIPYKTCEEIMREVDSELFIQCSRYTIINKKYMEEIDYTNRYIKLKYVKHPVEIGTVMKSRLKEKIGLE